MGLSEVGLNVARSVFRVLINLYFPGKPYSVKKVKRFGREFLVYVNEHVGRKIYLNMFEKKETEFLLNELRKDDVCLDIGANVGYFTFLFSSVASKVIAIEPIRQNADLIKLSSSINNCNHVQVVCAAVSNDVSTEKFARTSDSSLSSVYSDNSQSGYGAEDISFYEVPAISIDSLDLIKLDIVKMDIEGYEFFALQGMSKTLLALKPRLLMIEVVDRHLQRFGSSSKSVIDFLGAHSYFPKVLRGGALIPYDGQGDLNLFFALEEQ
ncbi:FkbM family methyltransferase [Pseudomonas benzenivorans]|uniref:FkbM family methyltransferase n=1 Tax=Pseudomonas benzenivorans TaxID=556533 RepID=A0ABY5H7U1_9PSED|nr:FkbM family methyltransferase [Pseudomonas benzenivorans]UTW07489.1 FkbM family methyltransferase [Pseudomonas benzenivorans]